MTIKQELNKDYVGNIVELFEIDLNPIGESDILRLTAHSESNVIWRGNTYVPFPLQVEYAERSNNAAPSRVKLLASTASTLLTSLMLEHGDLVGARVIKWRTLAMYLDAEPTADPNQHWPVERYTIIQRESLSRDGVSWVLANWLDTPNLILPGRQTLRDVASNKSLFCPGQVRYTR